MKNYVLFFLLFISLFPLPLHAEEQCSTDTKHTWLLENDPAYREAFLANQEKIRQYMSIRRPYAVDESVLKIPVVVHVIHQGEPEGTGTNISAAQIQSAITALNNDYRKVTGSYGDGSGVDTNIEFCLAKRNPSDQESSGINRKDGAASITDYAATGITGFENSGNEKDVKALSKWPNTDYYNIWIVNKIESNDQSGTQGYAYFPGASSDLDGAVILHNAFGTGAEFTNLKSFTNRNRTTTHELGHAFNLYHTFEGNSCTEGNCSTEGDECCDTPPTVLQQSCDSQACLAENPTNPQQIENYMDYTGQECKNMFTSCQKTRMLAAIQSSRSSLLNSDGCVPVTAPVSDFSAPSPTCSGDIQFTDQSTNGPDAWDWSFPGGTAVTSTDIPNPIINYSAGTYDVTLTASNTVNNIPTQGTTEIKTDYLKVFNAPASTCTITTSNPVSQVDLGITNVSFNTINNSSSNTMIDDTSFDDLTCEVTTILTPGEDYQISITTGSANYSEDIGVYIDYDNDGTFRIPEELAFSSEGQSVGDDASGWTNLIQTHTGTISIPDWAVTNTIIRMRVMSDFWANDIAPCDTPEYGQVEDYGIIFQATNVPVSDFTVETNPTCTGGPVQFYNQSTNGSSSWDWFFPGGTPTAPTEINPQVTYNIPALYSASLTASNEIGAGNTEVKTDFLGVYALQNAICSPTTIKLSPPDNPDARYNAGILNVTLNTINNSTENAFEDDQTYGGGGYLDFSCNQTTILEPSTSYNVSVTVGDNNAEYVYVFIDYNNNGSFEYPSELAFSSSPQVGTHTGSFQTPSNVVKNKMLRMRVTNAYDSTDACTQPNVGQVEDYCVVFPDNFATLSISQPSATIAGPNAVTYTVTYSGADTITLSANDVSLLTTGDANGIVEVSGSGNTWAVTISSLAGNGTLAIDIATGTAADAAGNPAIGKTSSSFTVDTTPPVVTIDSPANGLKTSDLIHILSYSVTETNTGTTTVTLNGAPITHTSGTSLTLAEGTSLIVVSHIDAAGNMGSATITVMANRGDINLDGYVNLADVILALKLMSYQALSEGQTLYAEADLDGDGKIGLHEIVFILRKLAGI